jgi:hypothetical protein
LLFGLTGLLLVRVEAGQLIPHGGHQQEHDATEKKIDEWNQRNAVIQVLLSAVAAACAYVCHGLTSSIAILRAVSPFATRTWRERNGRRRERSYLRLPVAAWTC